jgi:SP family sugar:H+ symporter-like MFS transporter
MTMGALGTVANPSIPMRQGIVAMLLVFSFGYEIGWAPITYLISTEIPTPSMRENTLRFGYTVKLIME